MEIKALRNFHKKKLKSNSFPVNVSFMKKPVSWILQAKCHPSTGAFSQFASNNRPPGLSINGRLAGNGLRSKGAFPCFHICKKL